MDSPEKIRSLTLAGRILAAVLLLGLGGGAYVLAVKFGRRAAMEPIQAPVPDVELLEARAGDVSVSLQSQGVLEPVTRTRAAAEVAGLVVAVSPAWREGAAFEAGDELLRLEDADYRAALANAEASMADAAMQLRLEQARAEQALRDWKKLGSGEPESDLVTRAPQIKAASARLAAASAAVEKAKHDLKRTVLRAPYRGRMLRTSTDVGSWVAPGTPLAEFYAAERLQVRLPLSLDDFTLLETAAGTRVRLSATAGDRRLEIQAAIVRPAAEIDRSTRTLPVIVEFAPSPDADPLLVPGLFVKAELPGRPLRNVIRIPRGALLAGDRVAVCTSENQLRFRPVKIARATRDDVLLAGGVEPGENILVTALAVITEGMEVQPVRPPAAR